ncbi:MAG: cytochrome c biogenesis protein CcdA [Acidimicrobiia bacterium]|nr:cytochrome c biogenesis protein CcdA [Acidimicrobiia bacterium]
MEGVFLGGSLLAAFIAGSVALFAPCCIMVMFPAYLAAAVRNHRWRLVPLTLVFAAGVATVLVPVTLGLTVLTQGLLRFHGVIYTAGGVLLLVLAGVAATGGTWSLPFLRRAPDLSRTDSAGVYSLGVFSGAASACCAPVLAGVLTLSAVSPGVLTGIAIGLAYVFGMVFPLVVLTLVWDRAKPQRFASGGRTVTWGVGMRRFTTTVTALVAAGMFAVMGMVLVVAGVTGTTLAPTFQTALGNRIERSLAPVIDRLDWIPDPAIAVLLVGLAVGAVVMSSRASRGGSADPVAVDQVEGSCHDHAHH